MRLDIEISPKASGNRCILEIDDEMSVVRILLVYSKNDINTRNETQEWKRAIKNQYPEIRERFGL